MDAAQWPQEIGLVKSSMEEIVSGSTTSTSSITRPQLMMERRARPQKEQALNCPRCNSTNTKFCYYNNYSLTQPRYFCKTCRRYWTEGGSLRNVPVGGGSRKNKRSSNSSSSTTTPTTSLSSSANSSKKLPPDLIIPPPDHQISSCLANPNRDHEGQDLNLAFSQFGDFPNLESSRNRNPPPCSSGTTNNAISAMELLRGGFSSRGLSPFMPMTMLETTGAVYPSGFGVQDFRSTAVGNFTMDGMGGAGDGEYENLQAGSGRMLFPFEDLRQVSSTAAEVERNRGQGGDSSGFWNGVMGGGGSW